MAVTYEGNTIVMTASGDTTADVTNAEYPPSRKGAMGPFVVSALTISAAAAGTVTLEARGYQYMKADGTTVTPTLFTFFSAAPAAAQIITQNGLCVCAEVIKLTFAGGASGSVILNLC